MTHNKKRSMLVTGSLALLLLVSGTFAWTSFSQKALNDDNGENIITSGGRIHDDYNRTSKNKDIYGENYGTKDLYVRIKLSEYFEQNGTPLVAGTTKADKSTWTPHVLPETTAPSNAYRNFVSWELGGDKIYLPTFNTDGTSLATDAAGDAIDVTTGTKTAQGDGNHTYFTNGQVVPNADDAKQTHTAKSTLTQTQAPISMAAWKVLPRAAKVGNYWVVDTDGWAYWANTLKPKQSTSLLLNQLQYNDSAIGGIEGTWYYGIDVTGEFATENDKDKFNQSEHGAPSTDAQSLINKLTAPETFTYNVVFTSDVTNVSMKAGDNQQFSAKVTQTDEDDKTSDVDTAVTWTLSPETAGTVDATGKVTINSDLKEDTAVTVTATSSEYDVNNTFTLTAKAVPAVAVGNVGDEFDFFGEKYINLKEFEDGTNLVLRKYVLDTTSATAINYNNSPLKTAMKKYYDKLSKEAQATVQKVKTPFVVGNGGTTAANGFLMTFGTTTDEKAAAEDLTTATKEGEIGEQTAFALSAADLSSVSGPGTDKAFHKVTDREGKTAAGVSTGWWLRTPAPASDVWIVSVSTYAGQFYGGHPAGTSGVRPALIIHR